MWDVLTIAEVVEVVRRLDERRGRAVSARQLRYWSDVLALGAGKAMDAPNAAHLFTPVDVALVRLVRQLQQDEVPARAIWGLLIHQGDALRAVCRPGTTRVVWIESNGRAHLLTGREAKGRPIRECYALADLVRGIPDAVRAVRAGDGEAWNGAVWVPAQDLAAAICSS
jgi:hypothetical protein